MTTVKTPKTPKTTKATKAAVSAPVVAVVVPTVAPANPFAALTQAPVAAVAATLGNKAKMLAEAAKVGNVVLVNGQEIKAANNVAARHSSLNGTLPVSLAATTYAIGKTPKLRVGYTLANWPAVATATDNGKGKATAAEIQAAGATTDFIRYAVRSGWLVAA